MLPYPCVIVDNVLIKYTPHVAGVKARRMVQLPTLELSFLFFIRNLKEDTVDKDFYLDLETNRVFHMT